MILLHPSYIFNTFLYNFYIPFTKAFLKLHNQVPIRIHRLPGRKYLKAVRDKLRALGRSR